jgi:hypothetical protein
MLLQLFMGGVMEALDSSFLQHSVHPLDLAVIRHDSFGALRSC